MEPRSTDQPKPLLDQYRGSSRRLVVHPLERAALGIVCIHLVFLPWALGGMRLWAQIPSLILAIVGFVVALIPRNYDETHTGSNRFRLIMWPKLVRFPLFWLGLALLGYVAIQNLNPAWIYRTDGKVWWMVKQPHTSWLPSGVDIPFLRGSPWQVFLVYTAAWLTVSTVWVAVTRRRTLQLLLMTVAANGLLVGLVGLAQRMIGNGRILWFLEPPRDAVVFGTFIYKNHGAAYLDLVLAVTCGLAGWYYLRGLRRLEKSNPSGVLAFCATCIGIAVLVSYARGATLVMLVFLALCLGGFIVHQIFFAGTDRKPVIAITLLVVFGFFLKTGLEALDSTIAWDRLKNGISEHDNSMGSRRVATTATIEMAKANWPLGAGTGSFRYLFPAYQQHHPEIYMYEGRRMYWEHAHNDAAELLAELGVFGVILFGVAVIYLGILLIKNFFWQNPLSATVVLGLVLLLGYSGWDFPFQCPAFLILWWILAIAAVRWAEMEELHIKG